MIKNGYQADFLTIKGVLAAVCMLACWVLAEDQSVYSSQMMQKMFCFSVFIVVMLEISGDHAQHVWRVVHKKTTTPDTVNRESKIHSHRYFLSLLKSLMDFSLKATLIHYNGNCCRPITFQADESAFQKTRYTWHADTFFFTRSSSRTTDLFIKTARKPKIINSKADISDLIQNKGECDKNGPFLLRSHRILSSFFPRQFSLSWER